MLNLISNPVTTSGGETLNLFAGFLPVEFGFKREDLQVSLIEEGTDGVIRINISEDLSSYKSVGDSIYLYGLGDILGYEYDGVFEILDIGADYMELDGDFIEQASSGYINYKNNYYVEIEIISALNNTIKLLPFTLRSDGDNAGNITINVSIVNYLNAFENMMVHESDFASSNGIVLTDARVKFQVKYREVYDQEAGNYTTVTDEIILIYASKQPENEELMNDLSYPPIYKGYPFFFMLNHSDANVTLPGINIYYDILDINKAIITPDNLIKRFNSSLDYGLMACHFDKTISLADAVKYIKFHAAFATLPEYEPSEYENTEYKVT